MRHFFISTVFILLPSLIAAQELLRPEMTSPRIAQTQAGVICAQDPAGSRAAPGTLAGTMHLIDHEPIFVSRTRRVPAVLGIGFGVKSMSASPQGLDNVTMVITHPPMGPDKRQRQSYQTSVSGTDLSLTFYQFDAGYELVTGTWQMSAFDGDDLLYSVTFEVVAPAKVPELAQVCGFENLLS